MQKEICLKCHLKDFKYCYPHEAIEGHFNEDWEKGRVWCNGLQNQAEKEDIEQLCGGNCPYLKIDDEPPMQFCYYKEEYEDFKKTQDEK